MVAPFTPYVKTILEMGPHPIYERQEIKFSLDASGVRQKPPYVNTAYSCRITTGGWGNNTVTDSVRDVSGVIATNAARARLVAQLGDTSSFGATMTAERRETYGMLLSGVATVFKSARALKRGDVVGAARLLGVAPPTVRVVANRYTRRGRRVRTSREVLVLPNGRQVAHNMAGKWLWFSYGVQPLTSDIYNACDVLQRPIPYERIKGSGIGEQSELRTSSFGANVIYTRDYCRTKVKMSVDVRVINPNLFLANQMGLTNPLQWINEAIMFSFVIDWFSNLSQVISQMTDFVGLETSDPVTSTWSKQTTVITNSVPAYVLTSGREEFSRQLLIPPAKLRFAYERFQWQRGANAISLLVGFLKKG
jgi:hypothetical protein